MRAAAMSLLLLGGPTVAQALPDGFTECAALSADGDRLACYDRIAGRHVAPAAAPSRTAEDRVSPAPVAAAAAPRTSSPMTDRWELDEASKRGTFQFRPHGDNYLIGTYNPRPNDAPYRPFRSLNPDADLSHGELAFQLGFKLKVAENPGKLPVDIWFGYIQRSFWQAGNWRASSPFRETNYQPEVMAVMPTSLSLLGVRLRFLNLGFAHQSNGQGSTLSRSWNRVYLQAGLERGDFQLLARAWKRIKEDADEDDNPGITDYLGHGDLAGRYHWNGHEFSLTTRYNFNTDKGGAQIAWAFPVSDRLKGYVQYFTGYGYTLIDYNQYQRVLGLGVLVTY